MPTMTIDGRRIEFQPGQTIIEVANAAGIDIPHYCYHPGLSVAGNCRICMVEVEKNARPQIACYVQATDGMVVHTKSPFAKEAQAGTMEMLLVNHPLDCPICDQAGECKLQDYAYDIGNPGSRSPVEKTHLDKNVPFGQKIVYDGERCIKCTRCVRFTDEISKTHELSMGHRGDHEEVIMTSKGEFQTSYAMNIVDLCPVGALTSRDFRFESRLWFMDFTESVCTGCARGCNVTIGARGGRFLRMAPRENQDVNGWWMCDWGRLGYKFVNSPSRVHEAQIRGGDGVLYPASMDEALALAAALCQKSKNGGTLVDAGLSLEEMWILKDLVGGDATYSSAVGSDEDGFLIVNEKGANQRGAEAVGYVRAKGSAAAAVLAVERDANVPKALRDGSKALVAFVADLSLAPDSARVVFPLATWAEKDGLLVNVDGLVQEIRKSRGVGPRDLKPTVDLVEDLFIEMNSDYQPLGRAGVVELVKALPVFRETAFPATLSSGAPARSVAAPPGRTR